jgi:hypothetical protein
MLHFIGLNSPIKNLIKKRMRRKRWQQESKNASSYYKESFMLDPWDTSVNKEEHKKSSISAQVIGFKAPPSRFTTTNSRMNSYYKHTFMENPW